ncbi:MAG: hypothetical protein EPN62_04060 [Candidimonas sp.]|nr:MAG: hypothetical protein EPN77_15810 [Candidimonas sp.]TAM25507.1 MAG: hypothetical protein EPN62_04060 [Candidimonas sp.]
MVAILEVESTLTDRYQTTVPETVRRALGLDKRDKIHYTIRPHGGQRLDGLCPPAVSDST